MRDEIARPVTFVRLLKSYGLSLRSARDVLECLAKGETATVFLRLIGEAETELARLGVEARVAANATTL